MNKLIFFLAVILLSCEKEKIIEDPKIDYVEKTKLTTGATLIISGEHFSTNSNDYQVSIDDVLLENIIVTNNILGSVLEATIPPSVKSGYLKLNYGNKSVELGYIEIKQFLPTEGWEIAPSFNESQTPDLLFKFKNSVIFRKHDVLENSGLFSFDGKKWKKLKNIPFKHYYYDSFFVVNGLGYIISSYSSISGVFSKDVWEYNPENDKWTKLNDFPGKPRSRAKTFVSNDKAYFGLGLAENFEYLNDLWEFNPVNKSWVQKRNFPFTTPFNDGGFDNLGYIDDVVYFNIEELKSYPAKYFPKTDSWETAQFQKSFDVESTFNFNNEIFGIDFVSYHYNFLNQQYYIRKLTKNSSSFEVFKEFPGAGRAGAVSFSINNRIFVGMGQGYKDLWSISIN